MDQSLASLMRNINDALRLDDDCHDKEAYLKYLDCVLCVTCNLQQYVRTMGGDVVITKEVIKQVKLAQQCIDRVAVLVEKMGSNQRPMVLKSPQEENVPSMVKPKPFVVVPPLPPEPTANTFARAKKNSPMEMAYKQNQQLMAAYKARLKRMNKGDPGAFNLSLTIQRKMAENLAIAKRTEMALAKKMQERQERLEEQAAKRFAAPIGMSQEEQEQRQIYKKILEYEQDAKWLQAWRAKLGSSPREPELICQLIQEILRCQDHPLTVLLRQYQYKVYEKIYPLVASKRQRLEAVKVPLAQSLWPPDLCPVLGNLHPLAGRGDLKGGGEDKEEEDEGIQTDQDSLPHPPSRQAEEAMDSDHGDSIKVNTDVKESDASGYTDPSSGEAHHEHCESKVGCVSGKDLPVADGDSESDTEKKAVSESCDSLALDHNGAGVTTETLDSSSLSELHSNSGTDKVTDDDTGDLNNKADSQDIEKKSAKSGEGTNCESASENIVEEDAVHSEHSATDSIAQAVENSKENVSRAISKGEHLQTQLSMEQERAARILRQITQDYETYNAENMDDLFDDDEEEGDQSTYPQSNNPTESQRPDSLSTSTQSSVETADSGTGSVSSTQDFPSLPHVDEDRSDIERMSKEAYHRHLKNISADVHMYMEKLLFLFIIAYEQLDSPQGRDQCYASLEETFFRPLWKFLLMMFRLVNYEKELAVACKMTQKSETLPKDMGVTDKLCLVPAGGKDPSSPGWSEARPYAQAINHLACIKNHYTMLSKLECVVKVVHLIFDSIKHFYISQGYAPSDVPNVGADDLLPVMSYVVMQSQLPQLVSECHAMSEFIHEGYMMGQEGYCLTTLETAVSFIVSSDLSEPLSPS